MSELGIRKAHAVPRKGIGDVDAKILRYADSRSLEQISEIIGGVLSPEAVGARAQVLLKTPDWLTAAQKDQVLLGRMHELLEEIEEYFQDEKTFKLRLDTLKSIGDRLDKRKAATDNDLNMYSRNIGRQIGALVDESLAYMKGALREDVDGDRWEQIKEEAMTNAYAKIAAREVEE